MSALAGRLAVDRRRDAQRPARRETEDRATLALRLAAFAALAGFAAAHWARMVAGPPVGALLLSVLLAAGLGVVLAALGRAPLPRPVVHAAAAAAALAFAALGLVAVGLDARLLAPGGWAELADELDRGLAGIPTVEWPYGGSERAVREAILYATPALLTLGAALAFWPARHGRAALRGAGLAVVLLLYGVAVTEHDPGEALLRGFVLLALLAAWLWLPLLRGRQASIGAGVVLAVGVFVLPFAAKLDSAKALVDYRSWDWVGGADVTFDWEHSYGPLDWPRDGTTLLNVESERPLYWKAETLDGFDGLRWLRTSANDDTQAFAELPADPDPRWQRRFDVTVRALRTDFVVVAGTPFELDGVGEQLLGSADGTVRSLDDPLRRGDSYTVEAYVPDPGARRLRAADIDYPQALSQYTRVGLPRRGETALEQDVVRGDASRSAAPPLRAVDAGLWDGSGLRDPGVARAFERSPYAQTYALARRLVDGQPTVYDAVANVERHLERSYRYNERPPSQEYPLESFLFEDRIGYCQQFSGAMALMLRMTGIPTRVVSGFSPGSRNRDTGEYRVRDLDAHSWVEVYFSDIGWVTFDPTPAAAPAQRDAQTLATDRGDSPGAALSDGASGAAGGSERALDGAAVGPSKDKEEGLSPWAVAVVLGLLVLVAIAALALRGRARAASGSTAGEQGLAELERALRALGWSLPAGTTLLELERRLGRFAGPTAASYAARLRSGRYARGALPALGGGARRALRRELTAGGGVRARLRGLIALPPSLPRFRRG